MKKHEESRRAFLIGTAVGASAVAGAGLVPNAPRKLTSSTTRPTLRPRRRKEMRMPAGTARSSTTTMPSR